MTTVILIRHGETTWNLEGKCQGQLDSPLTGKGIQQAKAVAARLQDGEFTHIHASDLGRAWNTAGHIAAATGRPLVADPRLRERNFGIFHGLDKAAMQEKYPEEFRAYASGDSDYVIPKGESLRQLSARSLACVQEVSAKHAGQRLVMVSHGGVLGEIFKHVLGLPIQTRRPFRIVNASLNVISLDRGRWVIESLGDVGHLRRIPGADDIV